MVVNTKYIILLFMLYVLPKILFSQENERYKITINHKDASISVALRKNIKNSAIYKGNFVVLKSFQDPSLSYMKGGWEAGTRVPNWKKPVPYDINTKQIQEAAETKDVNYYYPGDPMVLNYNGPERVTDYFKASYLPIFLKATAIKVNGNHINWIFPSSDNFVLTASFILPAGDSEPIIRYEFTPNDNAWYSVGYNGSPEMTIEEADAIWQPLVWQGKRFPSKSVLTLEDAAPMPAVLVEKSGITTGVIADPDEIPFRLPSLEKNAIKSGVLIRNEKGNVQPMVFSPVLGTNESNMKAGVAYSFRLRLLVYQGPLLDAHQYIAEKIFMFKDYRKNVFYSLNHTITNMTKYVMNDNLVNFNSDLRGFDYSTDVLLTVKNVSPLHPLSIAMITDDKDVYERRAKPMIEFALSREKYLFSRHNDVDGQGASSNLSGPGIEVSELAALHTYFGQKNPLFLYFADSMLNVTKQFNMNVVSKGKSFINLLALYQTTKDESTLKLAIERADAYIAGLPKEMAEIPNGQAQFFTDYAPLWMELLALYEQTKEKRFLNAAVYGAKLYLQYVWFYPCIPNSSITINKGNKVDFKGFYSPTKEQFAKVQMMKQAEQEVPAWRVSQIGLHPEASSTVTENPAIFLSHFAAHLLRLSYYTNNEFYRSVARSAIVGRYSNYPGYDINGVFTTIYEQPDYPCHPLNEVAYNQLYYNHVFPHIALLYDYLISDAFVQSLENISFPHRFSPGYAYLKSNVYGYDSGKFYADKNVNLWMPADVLKLDNEQINYLTAYGNNKFYVVLLNQSDADEKVTIQMNPNLIPFNYDEKYHVKVWMENKVDLDQTSINGRIKLDVKAKGITAIAVEGINIKTKIQDDISDSRIKKMGDKSFRIIQTPVGKISSSIICLGKGLSEGYVWLEANPSQLKKVKLGYRFNNGDQWESMEDNNFPYEFRIPLTDSITDIELRVEGGNQNENAHAIANWRLSKL
jgi:hypothetical protein